LIWPQIEDSYPPIIDIGHGIAFPIGSLQACPVLIEGVVLLRLGLNLCAKGFQSRKPINP